MRQKEDLFDKNFKPDEINWLEIYNQCVNEMWDTAYRFVDKQNIVVDRVNPAGIHRPDGYYYLWLIYPAGRAVLETEFPDDEIQDRSVDDWQDVV